MCIKLNSLTIDQNLTKAGDVVALRKNKTRFVPGRFDKLNDNTAISLALLATINNNEAQITNFFPKFYESI